MKICPKCDVPHEKPGTYCSRKCANSRTWSDETNKNRSKKMAGKNCHPRSKKHKKNISDAFKKRIAERKLIIDSLDWDALSGNEKRDRISKEQSGVCNHCKNKPLWNKKPLILELEHKDGNNKNNIRENLELICPNCHSQTATWKMPKKYRNNGRVA